MAFAGTSPRENVRIEHGCDGSGQVIASGNLRQRPDRNARCSARGHQAHAPGTSRGQFRVNDATRTHRRRTLESWHPQPRHLVPRIDAGDSARGRAIRNTCSTERSRGLARSTAGRQCFRIPHSRAESGRSANFILEGHSNDLGWPSADPDVHLYPGVAAGMALGRLFGRRPADQSPKQITALAKI